MALLVVLVLAWISLRTMLLLFQAQAHSEEARLGRAFQAELRQRGLFLRPQCRGPQHGSHPRAVSRVTPMLRATALRAIGAAWSMP
mgnify:CR=1 FL=1